MGWFSKKKWYIVTWKFESWATTTYTDAFKATCAAHAAKKVVNKHKKIFIVKVEEVEE